MALHPSIFSEISKVTVGKDGAAYFTYKDETGEKGVRHVNLQTGGACDALILQDDGKLVARNGKITVPVETSPQDSRTTSYAHDEGLRLLQDRPHAVDGNHKDIHKLVHGDKLLPGQCMRSQNRRYTLLYQHDGDLVLYDARAAGAAVWATGTNFFCVATEPSAMQMETSREPWHVVFDAKSPTDSGFFVYNENPEQPEWGVKLNFPMPPNSTLTLENGGDLVIAFEHNNRNTVVWRSIRGAGANGAPPQSGDIVRPAFNIAVGFRGPMKILDDHFFTEYRRLGITGSFFFEPWHHDALPGDVEELRNKIVQLDGIFGAAMPGPARKGLRDPRAVHSGHYSSQPVKDIVLRAISAVPTTDKVISEAWKELSGYMAGELRTSLRHVPDGSVCLLVDESVSPANARKNLTKEKLPYSQVHLSYRLKLVTA